MSFLHAIGHAASAVGAMTWEVLWGLIFGFFIAAVIESVVSKRQVSRLLPNARPRSLATAAGLGIASSSCSYAAVALARALFRRGANFTSAIAFQIASTNLVVELGAILWVLIGWQFTLAEYVGGIVMIVITAVILRFTVSKATRDHALEEAQMGRAGSMEGHAAMEMHGWKAIPDNFVMEWAATLRDIAIGLVIAGCIDAWVPMHFWQSLFFTDHSLFAKFWGPLIGPVIAVLTFVCSIGNVPLAAVLWNDGISFGGVVSFLFADLIIVPIVLIYRKYYGAKVAAILFGALWFAATVSGYVVEALFGVTGAIPSTHHADIHDHTSISWNYTTYLNIVALVLAAGLLIWFWRKGSMSMLKMMNGSPDGSMHDHSGHGGHDEHEHNHEDHAGHTHSASHGGHSDIITMEAHPHIPHHHHHH